MAAKKARKGKVTHHGSAGPDDPIYKEGPQVFTPVPRPVNNTRIRTATAEDYKKMGSWQIGTFHRVSPPTTPAPDTVPNGDMSDIKTAAKLQGRIDEAIRKMDKKDGYTS